ncbi:unnamed protein product [Enterobius vermicularis]|uniref:PH domain-containing protein n=1 Tax=Enterobius vermicularis TaxID=51028 RepID=A0A0N4VGE6_ENTVE|nr:unnamed protein product [Enterobius vermicularis]
MLHSSETKSEVTSPKRLSGFICKLEQRAIGGYAKRRYWFALSDDSPYLYWYKNKGDIKCAGRVSLSGAAFTFDPRQTGRFEIHVNDEIHLLETGDNKSRLQWLQQLQRNRRLHFERENVDDILKVEIVSLSSRCSSFNEQSSSPPDEDGLQSADKAEDVGVSNNTEVAAPAAVEEKCLEEELLEATQSTFYLNSDGELNARSLQMPSPIPPSTELLRSAEDLVSKIEFHAKTKVERPAKHVIEKAKASFRLPSFSAGSSARAACEQCKILLGIVNELKDRCYELTDEVGANQDLVSALRQALIKANRQIETLKSLASSRTVDDRVDFILNRESEIATLQMNEAKNLGEIQELEQRNSELNSVVEAFRDSVRTKEELIIKLYGEQEGMASAGKPVSIVDDIEVPEGILVDFGNNSTDEDAQKVFDEAVVNDVTEMRDLVDGYRSQNMFLNQEVLELQKIVRSLEERERRLIRQNFDIGACYYQLKSRYIMVLNHFKGENQPNSKVLEPSVIEELIEETNWMQNRRTWNSDKPETSLTNSLGFYLNSDAKHHRLQSVDMLDVAAELKNKSEEIVGRQELEQSPQYIGWLQRWDSFLVNYVTRPLKPSADLKELIRTGVPQTYRRRVWKSLVTHLVADQQADLGNGYYQSLLRKYKTQSQSGTHDKIINQIDLDLVRTLPDNKYFDDPNSPKITSLRKGMNRLAAIALLFLDESDAFWFLVACVEHLQPSEYYTPTLVGAVADQKVLRDLVGEKLPRLSQHLKRLDVDLPAFTLSWFLTCFVDTFPHSIYLRIFDVFLYEGNKVLFRFALALLKLAEASVLECKTVGGVQNILSKVSQNVSDYKILAHVAFAELNPFPMKGIDTKRQFYRAQLRAP